MAAFATIRLFQAVCLGCCIEVGDMTLGDAVVAEEQLVEGLRQVGPHGFSQGIQIGLVIVIGGLHCQRHMGVMLGNELLDPLHGGFETAHGIMREQGNQKQLGDPLLGKLLQSRANGRILIAHGELNR